MKKLTLLAAGSAALFSAWILASPAASADDSPNTPISNPAIKVDVLDYSWKPGMVWERFGKTECTWSAKVKNNNPEPRHICLNFQFLDENRLPVFQNGKCEVILGNSEGEISGQIMVYSRLIDDVKQSTVIPLEAHKLHSFVRPPAPPSSDTP